MLKGQAEARSCQAGTSDTATARFQLGVKSIKKIHVNVNSIDNFYPVH